MPDMQDELSKLFESTKRLYKSDAQEAINRLSLIRNSSLLNAQVKPSIDIILNKLTQKSNAVEESKDFPDIHKLEREIRKEGKAIELLENAISTFISNRSLSTSLSILFDYLYREMTKEELPLLVISREGEALQTYPNLRNEDGKLLVGVIGIPLYSVSHISEWILAGHEFGHIIAHKKLGVGIEYKTSNKYDARAIRDNYMMEILADLTAVQIFGPVFLEALLTRLIGAEGELEKDPLPSSTHPPIPWRVALCYEHASNFDRKNFYEEFEERNAKGFIKAIESVIGKRYPEGKFEKYKGAISHEGAISYGQITDEYRKIPKRKFEAIRSIEALKECYKNAYKVSDMLGSSENIPQDYSSDQIVIGGYLASREKPTQFKSYTQRVIDLLLRTKK
jgi:hypothetical protein